MTTDATRKTLEQIESWRRARVKALEREREALASAVRYRLVAVCFAAAALGLGALAVLSELDVRRLGERVRKAESDLGALEVSAAFDQDVLTGLQKELRSARDALTERNAAGADLVERLGRAEEELAAHDDAIHRAGFADLEEALSHAAVHHGQLSYLSDRLGWCRRDRDAAQCALGGETWGECHPERIDFGGRAAGNGVTP